MGAIALQNGSYTLTMQAPTLTSNQTVDFDFGNSKGTSGYQKLPNGLIIQWGVGALTKTANITNNFPIAFPNACLVVANAHRTTSTSTYRPMPVIKTVSYSTTSVVFRLEGGDYVPSAPYVAIGY